MRMSAMSIRGKLFSITLLSMVAIITLGGMMLYELRIAMEKGSRDKAEALVESVVTMISAFEARVANGEMSREQGETAAKQAVRAIRHSQGEYFYVIDDKGLVLVHGAKQDMEGKTFYNVQDASGKYFVHELIAASEKK